MKITFVNQDLFQQGAEYVTAMIVSGFVKKGYEVDLILSQIHADLLRDSSMEPFKVPAKTNIIILPYRKARENVRPLRKYLQETDSRVVVAMIPTYLQALSVASIGLFRCPKLAYVDHGIHNYGIGPKPFSKRWLVAKLAKWRFDKFLAVSKGTTSDLEVELGLKHGEGVNVYNPVIDELFLKKIKGDTTHEWLVHKTIPTFIAAGAHCEVKNHLMLFEAIKIANKTTPVRLVLFGRGVLTEQYKLWIKDNDMVDYIDLASHTSNLPAEMKSSDGLIISSNEESFSIVLIEAIASRIPVISTNCPFGPPELLEGGKYGCLVPVGDSESMAQAIVNQINNPNPPAPNTVWQQFTVDQIVAKYEQALSEFFL